MNQTLFLRDQLMSWSALATRSPSSKRLWMIPLIAVRSAMSSSGLVFRPHPGEVALAPHVRERHHQDGDEDEPLDVGERPERLEDGGPGQQEHRLDVEHDEDEGEHVEA